MRIQPESSLAEKFVMLMRSRLPKAKCKNAFKVACPLMLYFSSFSSFGLPARAGKMTLERGLRAHSISDMPEKVLDDVIRRSSVETDARAWSLYEITKYEVSARAGSPTLERTARTQISRFVKEFVFF